jgi:hypothetical protein
MVLIMDLLKKQGYTLHSQQRFVLSKLFLVELNFDINILVHVVLLQFNVSPSFTLELLDRFAKVFKDYCGVLTEEGIRKNFILIYELLDEMVVCFLCLLI